MAKLVLPENLEPSGLSLRRCTLRRTFGKLSRCPYTQSAALSFLLAFFTDRAAGSAGSADSASGDICRRYFSMQVRSHPAVAVSTAMSSRFRNIDVPTVPLNSPGLNRSGSERTPRFCPSASLVLERVPQDRLLSTRVAGGDSSALVTRRNAQKYLQCHAWAPASVPVPAPVPASVPASIPERVFEEEILKPLPPQESPADDPRLGNPLARMERVNTSWMGVSAPYLEEYLCFLLDVKGQALKCFLRA